MKMEATKAYSALAGTMLFATVIAATTTSWLSIVPLAAGAVLGVMLGGRFGSLTVLGVVLVVAAITIVVPVLFLWFIVASIQETNAAIPSFSDLQLDVAWYAPVPTIVAVITLLARRNT